MMSQRVLMATVSLIMTHEVSQALKGSSVLRNCRDVQEQMRHSSGVYTIYPYDCCPTRPLDVFCDLETDGGGWTVFQRRDDIVPREDFFRTWMEYTLGFGNPNGEFWLGNDHLHALTNQASQELRVDLEDFEGNTRWAMYRFFYVHERNSSFRMEVNGYTGNAGESFIRHSGMMFTTKDRDLDVDNRDSCAEKYKGGWWYENCHSSNLNGLYLQGEHTSYADGVNWLTWRNRHYSLKKTEMKIRPAF